MSKYGYSNLCKKYPNTFAMEPDKGELNLLEYKLKLKTDYKQFLQRWYAMKLVAKPLPSFPTRQDLENGNLFPHKMSRKGLGSL